MYEATERENASLKMWTSPNWNCALSKTLEIQCLKIISGLQFKVAILFTTDPTRWRENYWFILQSTKADLGLITWFGTEISNEHNTVRYSVQRIFRFDYSKVLNGRVRSGNSRAGESFYSADPTKYNKSFNKL